MGAELGTTPELLTLRYTGMCRTCGLELRAGTAALYHREAKAVVCVECPRPAVGVSGDDSVSGTAGASAQREFDRRKDKREARIREAHPRIGGLVLALTSDPQSTTAWATGATGEAKLGRRLDGLAGPGLRVLHDRRIPGTKANIDHIVIGPSGVFVIDAKKYKGTPSKRVEGGFFSPRTEKLMVGGRNCTNLVLGVHKQTDLVRSALDSRELGAIAVSGMICFVDAEWPLLSSDFTIDEVQVLWPKRAERYLLSSGDLDVAEIELVYRALEAAFARA